MALGITITSASGLRKRLAGDEPEATDIPQGLTFGTSIPGGFSQAQFSLARLHHQVTDLDLFDHVRVYGPGNVTVWEGRIVQLPRKHGDTLEVGVGCVGHSAQLLDDPSFTEIYVDLELGKWGPVSNARRLDLLTLSPTPRTPHDPRIAPDTSTGETRVILSVQGPWSTSQNPNCEARYEAPPGCLIAEVFWAFFKSTTFTPELYVFVSDNDDMSSSESTANLNAASDNDYFEPATARRFAGVRQTHGSSTASNEKFETSWRFAVFGDHGLTRQGEVAGGSAGGYYLSDIVADIVSRTAPQLTYSTGEGGSIETNQFVVTHLTYPDPTTGNEAVQRVNIFALNEWGVYDDQEFFWRAPDPDRLTWQLRLDDGVHLDNEGEDADSRYNGVLVFYQDPAGQRRIAGPTGSGFDVEDDDLLDDSETNPVNSHGIAKKWGKLQIDFPCDDDSAIQLGRVWLAEHSIPQHRGQAVATGTATHPTKGERPVYEIRAGDYVEFGDEAGAVPRRVIETSYAEGDDRAVLSLSNTVWKLESILERMATAQQGKV